MTTPPELNRKVKFYVEYRLLNKYPRWRMFPKWLKGKYIKFQNEKLFIETVNKKAKSIDKKTITSKVIKWIYT